MHPSFSAGFQARVGARVIMLIGGIGAGLSLAAAELVVRDLQAGVLVLPTAFDFTLDTPAFSRTGEDRFDAGTAIELGGRYSISRVGDPFGLVVGFDATTQAYSYESEDFLLAFGGRASLGAGYAFSDTWAVGGELGAALGWTELSLPARGANSGFDADGGYVAFDGRLAVHYTITRRLLVSLQGGYVAQTHELTTDGGDDLELEITGAFIGVGVAWRLSTAPQRVE